MTVSVVMAAGGTGGHLLPALAIASSIRGLRPDASISFVGVGRGLEATLVEGAGYRNAVTVVRPFTRDARGLVAPLSMIPATVQASRVLRDERASVVVGMGGYPSLPVILAARLRRTPSIIHEQNAIPGLANDVAARLTRNVGVAFADAAKAFPRARVRVVGVPLRAEIARFDRDALRDEALKAFGLDPQRRTVLIFGGSLGAARLNGAAAGLAARWRARGDLQMLVATGREHVEGMRARIAGDGPLLVRVEPFIERMDLAYAAADAVVSRAGASTVFELAAVGVPAALVPLPHARRREQDANAQALARAGAAVVVADADATEDVLAPVLEEMLEPARTESMRRAARGMARPNAADEMAAWALEIAERHGA